MVGNLNFFQIRYPTNKKKKWKKKNKGRNETKEKRYDAVEMTKSMRTQIRFHA